MKNAPTTEDLKKYFVDLTKYVPSFIYENIKDMKSIYKSQGEELGRLLYYLEDLKNQLFIDTATWGLTLWEKEFGIETNLNYSYEQRREVLKAKKRGQGTCTVALIKNVAESFSGGEVDVLENTAPYTFTIQFVGVKGIPKNMQGLMNAIDDIKPCHLGIEYEFTYNVWNDIKAKTWGENKTMTWQEIKEFNNNRRA